MVTHDVTIQGAGAAPATGPVILERTEQDFLPAVLDRLSREQGLSDVMKSAANHRDANGVLKLFQPIHRTFHIALLDASCLSFGRPRLDPAKIAGAGLVVRRISTNGTGGEVREAWMQEDRLFRGWVPFPNAEQESRDPDPAFRRPELSAGHVEINRLLAMQAGHAVNLREQQAPLFVAPPDICRATGRTLLYGVIPVTSSEMTESPTFPAFTEKDLEGHLHRYLTAGGPRPLPFAGSALTTLNPDAPALADFMVLLKQLAIEFDAFGETVSAQALFAGLNSLAFTREQGTIKAGDFLKAASAVLLERDLSGAASQTMPGEWPKMSEAQASMLAKLVLGTMQTRLSQLGGGQGRFGEEGRRYRVRAFVRVKHDDRCPPETVWSDYSEPFTIAPWYDNNGAPPVQISLPDVTDKGFLKRLKPNVAFALPEGLFNLLQGDAKQLSEGKGSTGPKLGIQWLCSFSIPLITICAFIVLNIFLQLFNLIFQWLLYIKICIPIPGRKS
ncbi:hypothetical protein ACO9S2_10540 [Nitrospira sp. NS4]|uniref:hypothetical protein n=1 Tax=Nitrospira sp. NS4 TaxID=3414498 RepID=UPI003C2DEDC7